MKRDTQQPGLIQRYREDLQTRQVARRTVKTYPPEMASAELNAFLSHLAVEEQVSASSQNQALSAPSPSS
ncbi:MAG: phage integrase N-terminal SAM-like domain-containing protein [Cyanobium sp. ELA712]